jgi:2-oxoglutarate ferredoxin oxidoreductase subunit alpha
MKQSMDYTWMIGGPQGGGINASAEMLAKAFSRAGLRVFANIEYHSNIKGKHSYYRVRDRTGIFILTSTAAYSRRTRR